MTGSPEFLQDIRDFVAQRRPNYGWVMRCVEGETSLEGHSEGSGIAVTYYKSSDHNDEMQRPRWTISYTLQRDVPATSLSWVQSGTTTSVFVSGNSFKPRGQQKPWQAVATVVLRGDGYIECWMPQYGRDQNREVQLYAPFARNSFAYADFPNGMSHVWWVRTGDGCGVHLGEKKGSRYRLRHGSTPTFGCGPSDSPTSVKNGDRFRLTRAHGLVSLMFNGDHVASGDVFFDGELAVQASLRYDWDRHTCTIGGDWVVR